LDVNSVYQIVLYIAAKNLQQGYLSPDDFNRIINQGQINYVSYLLGTFQQYTPGRPVARVELGQNSVVRQRLAPIIYGYNLNLDVNGYVNYPGDYLQTDSLWSIYGFKRVRYADQHKFASIYNSVIDPISTNPIYALEDVGFMFYPTMPYGHSQARLHYVRDAPKMVWGYDEDINGIPIYNPAKSTQPVFDDLSLYEIIGRAMLLVGVNLQAGVIMQFHNEIKNSGQ
jgi:hypothetical protein